MKKILTVLMVMLIFLGSAMPVLASSGRVYYINELDMEIEVPYNWDVLTRETTKDDTDLAIYGYDNTEELKQDFEASSIYMEIFTKEGRITFYAYPNELSKKIEDFTDNEKEYTDDFIESVQLGYTSILDLDKTDFESYSSEYYAYIKFSTFIDEENLYVEEYDTIVDKRLLYFTYVSRDEPDISESIDFDRMINSIVFHDIDDINYEREFKISLFGVIGILSVVIIILLIVFIKGLKKNKALSAKSAAMATTKNTAVQPFESTTQASVISPSSEQSAAEERISARCLNCGFELPENVSVCPRCGGEIK